MPANKLRIMSAPKAASPVRGLGDLTSGGFTYPAKLAEGAQEVHEGSGDWRLRLVFERHDRVWSDGNPVRTFVSVFTTYKGDPVWEGSDAHTVVTSFMEACGGDFLDDAQVADFIGHSFMLQDEDTGRTYTDKNGRERKAYLTTCIEYLGDNYVYDGSVRTIESASGDPAAVEEFDATPAYLAQLFDGMALDDLRGGAALDIVKDDESLAGVTTVLGKPLRGGLVKPRAVLIDRLIEEGFATAEDGIFVAAVVIEG